jgi:hypothetical protein
MEEINYVAASEHDGEVHRPILRHILRQRPRYKQRKHIRFLDEQRAKAKKPGSIETR